MSTKFFVADDAENEPTIWREREGYEPDALIRRCDFKAEYRESVWAALTSGFPCEVDE